MTVRAMALLMMMIMRDWLGLLAGWQAARCDNKEWEWVASKLDDPATMH